jgi:hypothetical protein
MPKSLLAMPMNPVLLPVQYVIFNPLEIYSRQWVDRLFHNFAIRARLFSHQRYLPLPGQYLDNQLVCMYEGSMQHHRVLEHH